MLTRSHPLTRAACAGIRIRCNATASTSSSTITSPPVSKALVPLPPRLLPVDEDAGVPRPPRRSRFSGTALVLGIIPVFTFGLGVWQIKRLKWKVALIEELDEKLAREPIPLPSRVNVGALPDFAFRKVRVRGTWDDEHTMLYGPKKYDVEHGYDVITPLVRSDGASTLLVNRGFISREQSDAFLERRRAPGEVEVLGMLHAPSERGKYTPDNDPAKGLWHWLDLTAMKAHAGGDAANVQAVLVDEIFDGHTALATQNIARGVPVGIPPTIELRNMHAVYAATWFSLSAATTLLFVRLITRGRGPNPIFNKPPRRAI